MIDNEKLIRIYKEAHNSFYSNKDNSLLVQNKNIKKCHKINFWKKISKFFSKDIYQDW